ncbi:hypothetical protein AVEN_51367-1 [Araneus ventricosus]|uniref:Uncharacterized protein n=1 Tax=Araneus ventricosus TaxID=182803 RepID=A0A4Y2HDH1_ARAVE|nr:hypothetical protein AVEN_51367-1 [Araneus ventricosus]
MDEKPEMFKSRSIDCVCYARTWNSFKFGKSCDKLEKQALVLMVDSGFSTLQYQRILEHAENLNSKLHPSHHKVKEAKQLCCPQSISVTETSVEITLQTLVDHTVSHICHIEFVTEKLRLLPEKTAEITGVEFNLIKRLGIILECINCNMKINLEKFSEFTRVTQDIPPKLQLVSNAYKST